MKAGYYSEVLWEELDNRREYHWQSSMILLPQPRARLVVYARRSGPDHFPGDDSLTIDCACSCIRPIYPFGHCILTYALTNVNRY